MDVVMDFQFERVSMNDAILFGAIFAAAAVAVVGFVFYSVYGGSKASLANAQEGQVFNFVYEQPLHGTHERFLAKVIGKQTLTANQIAKLNRKSRYRINDPEFVRTSNLVTCRTADGKVRNFYAERVTKCRKPLLAGALFKSGFSNLF
jgi:hypothetical protein